jgi:hypothetical protein
MKCDLPVELLSGYLDGELDEAQRKLVEKHLEECPTCKAAFQEMKMLDEKIRRQPFEEPSRDFIFGVNRRIIAKVRAKKRFPIFRYTPVFVPAAVALLILIIITNLNPPVRLIGINDRIAYAESKGMLEGQPEIELKIPAPAVTRAPLRTATVDKKELTYHHPGVAAKSAEAARGDYGDDEINRSSRARDFAQTEMPQTRVVRAIVDSTGMILRVATGNTIIPEKDSALENRLQGQQLTPPTVAGRKTQMYIDFVAVDTDEGK